MPAIKNHNSFSAKQFEFVEKNIAFPIKRQLRNHFIFSMLILGKVNFAAIFIYVLVKMIDFQVWLTYSFVIHKSNPACALVEFDTG